MTDVRTLKLMPSNNEELNDFVDFLKVIWYFAVMCGILFVLLLGYGAYKNRTKQNKNDNLLE